MRLIKEDKQFKNFLFTFHLGDRSYEECEEIFQGYLSGRKIVYLIMGREKGETGDTPHLQGYCMLDKRITWGKLQKILKGVHFRIPDGTPWDNKVYCSKEGNVVVEIGDQPIVKRSSSKVDYLEVIRMSRVGDLGTLESSFPSVFFKNRSAIDKLRIEGPKPKWRKKRGLYLVGKPRCGKTRFAHAFDEDAYSKAPTKWWCGYRGQKTVILDDLDKSNCQGVSWFLKTWMDGQGHIAETKFGATWLPFKTFIITSNYRLESLYNGDDELIAALHGRFRVVVVVDIEDVPDRGLELITQDPLRPMEIRRYNKFNIFEEESDSSD